VSRDVGHDPNDLRANCEQVVRCRATKRVEAAPGAVRFAFEHEFWTKALRFTQRLARIGARVARRCSRVGESRPKWEIPVYVTTAAK
jgi:hypothetical protein